MNHFDRSKFVKFETSSGLDGSLTGLHTGKILRIVEKNIEKFKKILKISPEVTNLINSKIFYEDQNILVIEHEKLDCITYYEEWTNKQKVQAAKTIVQIQSELSRYGFYLNDPHCFNITFKFYQPVYFDIGSIFIDKISPAWWFIKCFCGWTEPDYWDKALKINTFQKFWIMIRMFLSASPYDYLLKKLANFEIGFIETRIISLLSKKNLVGKFTRKMVNTFSFIFRNFSNWTDYEQKSPDLNFNDPRNKNILSLIDRFNPGKVLDIGANKGAFSFLALERGVDEVIALDLDNFCLDFLLDRIRIHKQKITVVKLNVMDYQEHPGHFKTYLPAHERLKCDFTLCLAVVHHVCYFGDSSFEEFAERLNRFTDKILVVEFVPFNDIHLTGEKYKGKDRSWYTLEHFISAMKKWFPESHELFESTPSPRILIKFSK